MLLTRPPEHGTVPTTRTRLAPRSIVQRLEHPAKAQRQVHEMAGISFFPTPEVTHQVLFMCSIAREIRNFMKFRERIKHGG